MVLISSIALFSDDKTAAAAAASMSWWLRRLYLWYYYGHKQNFIRCMCFMFGVRVCFWLALKFLVDLL